MPVCKCTGPLTGQGITCSIVCDWPAIDPPSSIHWYASVARTSRFRSLSEIKRVKVDSTSTVFIALTTKKMFAAVVSDMGTWQTL